MTPLRPRQRLIMHLDGDAFFVSVEMAKDPALRGRPVVTGQERGIASALSYEAKSLGITRAMPIFQIRKEFPQVVVVDSDYEAYAIFSKRMFDIVRRYTDIVEEYSIDECFADFSHMPAFAKNPRPTLEAIRADIQKELGISVSLGLGPTKVLAKTGSKLGKPNGLTILRPDEIPGILAKTPVDRVWGIGSATAFALRKNSVSSALELARKPLDWVEEFFSKPMAEMWYELNGISVREVNGINDAAPKSIQTTRTFVPASKNKAHVFSELSKNIEGACRRAREVGLAACEIGIFLKTRDFNYSKAHCRLAYPTDSPLDIIREAGKLYEAIFDAGTLYRSTGVTLSGLMPADQRQEDLFGAADTAEETGKVFEAVDKVNKKYGRSVVRIASSSRAFDREEGKGSPRKLSIPYLGEAV